MAVLEAEGVSRWHGEVIAVNGLDVQIEPGITGILGPNGAGKSTLIRMAMGLIRPSLGEIRVLGEDPWDNPELLRRIGYVPEGKAPWRNESGETCVRRAATLTGMEPDEVEEGTARALERVGLTGAAGKKVDAYSHGMQQRLKFAMALVHDPELFILDEPLIGADPLARRDLLDLMRALAQGGRSILLSTHVLPDVEVLTERIMLLNHGRLMAHGEVHEIRDLLDRFPRTVRIGTPDPLALGSRLWKWDTVQSLERDDQSVTVRTERPDHFFEELQSFLAKGKVEFTSVTSPDDNVEAVFRYLVK